MAAVEDKKTSRFKKFLKKLKPIHMNLNEFDDLEYSRQSFTRVLMDAQFFAEFKLFIEVSLWSGLTPKGRWWSKLYALL